MSGAVTIPGRLRGLARDTVGVIREQVRGADQPLGQPPSGGDLQPVLGQPGPPVIGQSLEYWRDPIEHGRQAMQRYGPLSWTRLFGAKVLLALGPEAAEAVLVNRGKAYANGPAWEYFIGPFFDRGLMLLDFEEHLHHRRIMQQAFTRDRLIGYLEGINDQFDAGFDSWEPRDGFAFHPAFKALTLDLANTVFVGHDLGGEAERVNRAFFDAVQGAGTVFRFGLEGGMPLGLPGGRWQRGLDGRRVLEEIIRAELPAKRAGDGKDLFTSLCRAEDEHGNTFTDDDVVNHMIFLLMAAHDTSTTSMNTLVYHLAKHPEWQQRLREQSEALGSRHLAFDDLAKLPDLSQAIMEAQRLEAPLPLIARYAVKDTELLGHFVPKGTRLLVNAAYTMQMPEWFKDPSTFDPDRFGPERQEHKGHPYAWMPFGGGVHKCIGMHFGNLEVTAALHQLLLRFEWSVPDGYTMPVNRKALPFPDDGLPIDLRSRG